MTGGIHLNKRVMHNFVVARMEFDRLDVAPLGGGDGNQKVAINILAVWCELVVRGQSDNQIGLSEPPLFRPFRHGRQISRFAFHCAFGEPLLDQAYLIHAQLAFARELAVAVLG